jgi:hypothetical protein
MSIYATDNYFGIASALGCAGESIVNCIAQSAQGLCAGSDDDFKKKSFVKKDKVKGNDDDKDNAAPKHAALVLALTMDSYRIPLNREVSFVDEIPAGKFS